MPRTYRMPASRATVNMERAASNVRHCTCKIKGSNLNRTGPAVVASFVGVRDASMSAAATGSCDASSQTPA